MKMRRRKMRDDAPIPDPRHVVSKETFVAGDGKRYEVIHTTERDPDDPPKRAGRKK